MVSPPLGSDFTPMKIDYEYAGYLGTGTGTGTMNILSHTIEKKTTRDNQQQDPNQDPPIISRSTGFR